MRQVQEADRAVSKDRVYGHTRSGTPITDKEIEALAAEADVGYDVDTLLGAWVSNTESYLARS
jgi:hypothetical protein